MVKLYLDLDGTVYLDGIIIDSVDKELLKLEKLGVSIFYITNNTSISLKEYETKLTRLKLPLSKESIISPTKVFSNWIVKNGYTKLYSIASSDFDNDVKTLTNVEFTSHNPELIIIAFDKELTYSKLKTACDLINRGIPYYLTHIDLACPTNNGPIPDCGSIGKLIEFTTKVPPIGHFGKPGTLMIEYIKESLNDKDELVVVGDRLYTDAQVGLELNARAILVCSGEFKSNFLLDDKRIEVFDTLSSFIRKDFFGI